MPTAGYSTQPQAGLRGNRPSSGRQEASIFIDCKKVREERKKESAPHGPQRQPTASERSSPRLTQKQAAHPFLPPVPSARGNAAGVCGLFLGQGHRQAPVSNVRAAQCSHFCFFDPALAGRTEVSGHLRREAVAAPRVTYEK